jgi:hypothetical protein
MWTRCLRKCGNGKIGGGEGSGLGPGLELGGGREGMRNRAA